VYFVLFYENVAILIYIQLLFSEENIPSEQNDGIEHGTWNCTSPAGLLQSGAFSVIVTNIQLFKCCQLIILFTSTLVFQLLEHLFRFSQWNRNTLNDIRL
jgi:hypothetical protein